MHPNELLETALAAARDAVAVHRRYAGTVRVEDWSEKGVADFVTHVDREAESRIVARITADFPDHAILAEEAAGDAAAAGNPALALRDSEWLWIVDPLDGTTNFLHGFPVYSASVGVAHRGELVAGAVVHGATGEAWTATRGGGAFRDDQPIHVSTISALRLALVGTGFPYRYVESIPSYLRQFDAVLRRVAAVRRPGSAALDLCHVASGHFDAFWEQRLAPWDVAAGTLIIREAGGVVTDLSGDEAVLGRESIVAGNPRLHEELLALLRAAETPAAPGGYAGQSLQEQE
ncbi:MAG TPA: inositol monophosphatase family protein [Longimicrobiales bacterium]